MVLITDANRMQNDPVVSRASELMRLGLMPSAEQLRGGFVRRVSLKPPLLHAWLSYSSLCRICSQSTFRRRGIKCKAALHPLFTTDTCIIRIKCTHRLVSVTLLFPLFDGYSYLELVPLCGWSSGVRSEHIVMKTCGLAKKW